MAVPDLLTGEAFGRLLDTFERTAFRLETRTAYDVAEEQEEIARFLAGDDMGPDWHDNPWVRSTGPLQPSHVLRLEEPGAVVGGGATG
ncbi:DUF6879 family protein [Streptomyces spectabilis]|uniref:DUF6879 family protein n=1 Tax=Streptomyces spectabilis TaxID=68270 RepID=UPI001CEFA9A1|nr:DUF6879 family protein [Streptomyces spectabilis]